VPLADAPRSTAKSLIVREWATVAFALVGTAALVALALLQYRWISRVSDAEHTRMQAHLTSAAERFQRDFRERLNLPLAAILRAPPAEARDDLIVTAARISAWMDTSPDRALVRTVYMTRGGADRVHDLFEFDPSYATFEPAAWTPALARFRDRLRQESAQGPAPGIAVPDPDLPALAMIHMERASREPVAGPPDPSSLRFAGWIVVVYDVGYLSGHVMPALVRRDLGISEDFDCASRIVAAGGRRVIYVSDPSLPAGAFAHPDAIAPLFEPGPPPPDGAAQTDAWPDRAAWLLEVSNRTGSLDQVVARTRLRNLAVSFAVLLLMAGAVAAVLFSARRAQRLAASQMEFVAGVSHELRTPLTVICSAADNLADGVVADDSRVRRYGSVIGAEGRRLTRILEQILRFAGIQSGRAKYQFARVDLASLVRAALDAASSDIAAAGFEVETAILPVFVLGDEVPLTQCFRNLIDNALAHARAGGWIGIHARLARSEVTIDIEDRGPGIEAAELRHVFDPFYRGRKALDNQVRGFGLGLTLVRRIVEAHGGSVAAGHRAGGGSRFEIRLPVPPGEQRDIAEEETLERETNSAD
jgi:signal transduction histidine kinase